MSLWEPVRPFVTSSVCKDGGTDEGKYDHGSDPSDHKFRGRVGVVNTAGTIEVESAATGSLRRADKDTELIPYRKPGPVSSPENALSFEQSPTGEKGGRTMSENPTTCRRCNAPNSPENRFCGHCGAYLNTHDITPEHPAGRPTASPEVLPARTRTESGRLRAVLGDIGKPVALGALVLVAEALAEAGVMWVSNRAGRHYGNTLSSSPEPANNTLSRGAPLELKSYEELMVFARDGSHVSRLFATRSVSGPPGGDG